MLHDKEYLQDETVKLKKSMHEFRNRNYKLKSKVAQCDKQLAEKDKAIHELLDQISSTKPNTALPKGTKNTHLINALKKQVRETREDIRGKEREIKKFMKSLKITRIQEIEVEIKMFADECTRLKHIIEEVMKQKAESYTPEDIITFKNKIAQQDAYIAGISQNNAAITEEIKKKDKDVSKWNNMIAKLKKRLNKLETDSKDNLKNKKQVNDTKREVQKLKEQITILKSSSKDKDILSSKLRIDELLKKNNELNEKLNQKQKVLKELEEKAGESKENVPSQELLDMRKRASQCMY